MENYQALHARSIRDPEGFWAGLAGLIDWQTPCSRVLEYSNPPFAKWFVGAAPPVPTTPWTATLRNSATRRR